MTQGADKDIREDAIKNVFNHVLNNPHLAKDAYKDMAPNDDVFKIVTDAGELSLVKSHQGGQHSMYFIAIQPLDSKSPLHSMSEELSRSDGEAMMRRILELGVIKKAERTNKILAAKSEAVSAFLMKLPI